MNNWTITTTTTRGALATDVDVSSNDFEQAIAMAEEQTGLTVHTVVLQAGELHKERKWKRCFTCNNLHEIGTSAFNFHKSNQTRDGYVARCRICTKMYNEKKNGIDIDYETAEKQVTTYSRQRVEVNENYRYYTPTVVEHPEITEEQRQDMLRMVGQGIMRAVIARKIGIAPSVVFSECRRLSLS